LRRRLHSLGTKAKEYIYSLSISPSAPLTREQYNEAIGAIENRLGLTDQPRAVVFHVKDGREHCHVAWSRIDVDKMRAVHMAHDHRKLMDLACELARKFGHGLPPGLKAWEEKQKREKEKLEATLGEKAQAEETGITPEQRREEITAAYKASDSAEAFRSALEQKGYVLARGDKRGLVVVDRFGNPHSLTRYIKGHSAKEIKAKLAALSPEQLPSVDQAKEIMRQRAQAQEESRREQQQEQERDRVAEFRRHKEQGLAAKQAARRLEVQQAEQQLFTGQQAERLALHAAQKSESRGFLFRVRSAVADLIRRTPGLRSVLSHIQKKTLSTRRSGTGLRTRRLPAAMRGRSGISSDAGGRSPGSKRGKGIRSKEQ
jgi:Relaxase/Mobilisation nuclease domain